MPSTDSEAPKEAYSNPRWVAVSLTWTLAVVSLASALPVLPHAFNIVTNTETFSGYSPDDASSPALVAVPIFWLVPLLLCVGSYVVATANWKVLNVITRIAGYGLPAPVILAAVATWDIWLVKLSPLL